MGLALVQVPLSAFQQVHDHLTMFMPQHRNMHLRQTRQIGGQRVLRYLHALYARQTAIEGMISGPSVFWHYNVRLVGGRTQMQVLAQQSPAQDDARLERRFLPEILARMSEERARTQNNFSNYSQGEFYLRRSLPGIAASHQHCRNAVSNGVLDQRFVSQLHPWNFFLLNP